MGLNLLASTKTCKGEYRRGWIIVTLFVGQRYFYYISIYTRSHYSISMFRLLQSMALIAAVCIHRPLTCSTSCIVSLGSHAYAASRWHVWTAYRFPIWRNKIETCRKTTIVSLELLAVRQLCNGLQSFQKGLSLFKAMSNFSVQNCIKPTICNTGQAWCKQFSWMKRVKERERILRDTFMFSTSMSDAVFRAILSVKSLKEKLYQRRKLPTLIE